MKQTNSLSIMNPKKNFTNSSSKKNFSSKITTSYNQILQESISDSSRQKQRNTSNSYKQNFNQNTSTPVTILRGDANNDGRVDRKDIDLISRRMVEDMFEGSDKTKINMMNSDYDNDGVITIDDFSVAVENLTKQEKITVDVLYGDANDDGRIDEKDKELVLNRMIADMEGKGDSVKVNMRNVDFSGDGKITPEDFSTFTKIYNEQQKNAKEILKGDANDDGRVDEKDKELVLNRMFADMEGKGNSVKVNMRNVDFSGDGKITLEDYSAFLDIYHKHQEEQNLVNKYDINNDGKLDDMDGAILRNEVTWSADLTDMQETKADFNKDGIVDFKDVKILDDILSKRDFGNFNDVASGIIGDVNNDGKIDFADTYLLDKAVTDGKNFIESELSQISANNEIANQADIDGDGKLTKIDLMALKKATNNYSDIHIFSMKKNSSLYDNSSFHKSGLGTNNNKVVFVAKVLEETDNAYRIELQAGSTRRKKQTYWIKKNQLEDLTPEIDKLVTEKMGISIVPRGYNGTDTDDFWNVLFEGFEFEKDAIKDSNTLVSKIAKLNDVNLDETLYAPLSKTLSIEGLVESGAKSLIACSQGDTGESTYYFIDLTAKVVSLIQPEVAVAWAAIQAGIEAEKYENSEKEFKTPLGYLLLDSTGLDTKIVVASTFVNKMLPVLEMTLGKDYAQKLIWGTEELLWNGLKSTASFLTNWWFSHFDMSDPSLIEKKLNIPPNPLIEPIPERK